MKQLSSELSATSDRGAILVFFIVLFGVMVLLMGLAIDGGRLFLAQRRVLDVVPGPSSAPLLPDSGFLPARAPRPEMSPAEWLDALRPPPETVYRDSAAPPPRP